MSIGCYIQGMSYVINGWEVSWFTRYVLFPLRLWTPPPKIKKHALLGKNAAGYAELYLLLEDGSEYVVALFEDQESRPRFNQVYQYLTGEKFHSTTFHRTLDTAYEDYLNSMDYPSDLTADHRARRDRLKRWGVKSEEIAKLKGLRSVPEAREGCDLPDPVPLRPRMTGTQDP